jgi:hypothetical protein
MQPANGEAAASPKKQSPSRSPSGSRSPDVKWFCLSYLLYCQYKHSYLTLFQFKLAGEAWVEMPHSWGIIANGVQSSSCLDTWFPPCLFYYHHCLGNCATRLDINYQFVSMDPRPSLFCCLARGRAHFTSTISDCWILWICIILTESCYMDLIHALFPVGFLSTYIMFCYRYAIHMLMHNKIYVLPLSCKKWNPNFWKKNSRRVES